MNRLDREDSFEGRLDRTWLKLTPEGKGEFERRYGTWERLSDAERYSSLSSYFSYLRQQAEDDRIRKITEPYVRAMEGLGAMLDKKFGQIEGKLGEIKDVHEETKRQIGDLESELKAPKSQPLPPGQPGTQAPSVYFNTALLMDCTYRADGPKGVVSDRQDADGVYRSCSVGQQIRARRMLPHILTSVYRQTGCPSNPLGPFRCEFIKYDRVKVS